MILRTVTASIAIGFSLAAGFPAPAGEAAGYDLHSVKDLQAFQGSDGARELLRKNGFVVSDPSFRQIFEAYLKSPQTEAPSETNPAGASLPSFITADSAWDTYHVLLEEGIKQLETAQAGRLLDFSQRLLDTVRKQNWGPELRRLAVVGLALQDETYRQTLTGEEKNLVEALLNGSAPVAGPIGFPLAPAQFRAQSFYAQSPALAGYFAARQWYASVVFRLASARETGLAVALATAVDHDAELLNRWRQLSGPYDDFLARAEDGTVPDYAAAARSVLGTNHPPGVPGDDQISSLQKYLGQRLPLPAINDQLLAPNQYAEYGRQTQGFRLLPPRRLPCAVCFQNTVDPKIPRRQYPSGLDFLAASPGLRSPAAVRAVTSQFGQDIAGRILRADCGPMPDSLHGEAMQLLAALQKPLPAPAPPAMRTEAWGDLQLWTQLGAWAEQRHTWALHTKMNVMVSGLIEPPKGVVAPYPEFFSGLAKLSRRTAAAFVKNGLEPAFEAKTAASDLLRLCQLSEKMSASKNEPEMDQAAGELEPLNKFESRYYEQHRAELIHKGAHAGLDRLHEDLKELAGRCAGGGTPTEAELATLRMFFDCHTSIARQFNDFAPVCERLAGLAGKTLTGEVLTDEDAEWIGNYGVTLAGFHFYYGNSYEVPRDDFPIVTRVYANLQSDSALYAGLARPQSLYVILPSGQSLQLYRGAVMTYREFVQPNTELLDDEAWRKLLFTGKTPPAPAFTRGFYAEAGARELIEKLRPRLAAAEGEEAAADDTGEVLEQLGLCAADQDLPDLFNLLKHAPNGSERGDIVDGAAEIIGRLAWQPQQKEVISLLASPDNLVAKAAARILLAAPESFDPALLTSDFAQQPPGARRLYCAILGCRPRPADATRQMLWQGLRDPAAGVRWQAVMAIGKTGWNDAPSQAALLEKLDDPNQYVGAAAAYVLARLDATNAAPALLAKLHAVLSATNPPLKVLEPQALEITREFRGEENQAVRVLDPDNLEFSLDVSAEVTANLKRQAALHRPPRPVQVRMPNYDLPRALIQALRDLAYAPAADELFKLAGTDYEETAADALAKLAPGRLASNLLAVCQDPKTDSYLREKAMVTLGTLSATNCARALVPLLDDLTPIVYSPPLRSGGDWRICDRAALTIATLLGWEGQPRNRRMMMPVEQRQELMTRVREWAKTVP